MVDDLQHNRRTERYRGFHSRAIPSGAIARYPSMQRLRQATLTLQPLTDSEYYPLRERCSGHSPILNCAVDTSRELIPVSGTRGSRNADST